MKNKGRIMYLLLVAVLLVALLSGCSLFGSNKGDDPSYCKLIFMEVSGIRSVELDGTPITLPVPKMNGYVFDGWYTSKDYSVKFDQDYLESHTITSDLKLYPKWIKIQKATLKLDVNGGDPIETDSVEIEKGVSTPQELGIPTGIGMTFDGWFTAKNGGERVTEEDGIVRNYEGDDAILYAHWIIATYSVTVMVEGNDSAVAKGGADGYKFGESVTLTTSSKDEEHYTFDGWYDGSVLVSRMKSFEYTVTGNAELIAKWIGKNVDIVFYANKTNDDSTRAYKSVHYGGTVSYMPEERVDYAFTGWYTDRECSGTPVSDTEGKISNFKPSADGTIILYAGWQHLPEGNLSLEYDEVSSTYTVVGLNNNTLSVVYIPHEYNGITVTAIGDGAFSENEGKSFVIPSTITAIGAGAFPSDATVYVDNGADASLIKTPTFTESMKIYFHILISDDDNALSDGEYAEADGKFITTEIEDMDDLVALYRYAFLYTVPSFKVHITETAYNGDNAGFEKHVQNHMQDILLPLGLKANTATTYKYVADAKNRTMTYEFTAENKVATKKTEGEDMQVQAYSANASFDGAEHEFAIDKAPEFYVETSEQMVYAVERGYRPYFAHSDSEPALIYKKAREVLGQIVKDGMNDYDKLLAIHDWIALNIIYDTELYDMANTADGIQSYRGFNLEGVFIDGRAVCDGITKAFMLMSRIEGIECIRVSGTLNGGNHAWNKVKLDGIWFVVDVTGDDAILRIKDTDGETTKYIFEELRHIYFLTSDAKISETHCESVTSTAPKATGEYNYYVNNGFSANTQAKLDKYFEKVAEIAKTVKSGSAIILEVNTKGINGANCNYLYENIRGCTVYGGTPDSDGVCVYVVVVE